MQKFLSELQRRKVLRVATGYVVAGWVILQVALSLQAAMSLPAWFSSAIMAVLLIGFPVAVFASWFFEFTPEGIRRTAPSDEIVPLKFQATDLGLAAALVLVLAAVAVKVVSPAQETTVATAPAAPIAPAPSAASIAVLPFADLSPGKDQEYFSDGMAEEILNVLAKVKDLDVASRTSSFQFKGREIGVPEIAKQLKVRHIVEGSVRKAGETLRITAQLIDTQSDRHLWSETFDRPLTTDNIFTIQDEIAHAIVRALDTTIGPKSASDVAVTPVTDNLTAYDLYLQARPMFTGRVDLDKADQLLSRAVDLDGSFAKAWEMRSAVQFLMYDYGYTSVSHEVANQRAREFANHALGIDPRSSLAIAVLAKLDLQASHRAERRANYDDIISAFNRSLAIDPRNASALVWRGQAYSEVGDIGAALNSFNQCLALEPYYYACGANKVTSLGVLGRHAEALEAYRAALNAGSVRNAWTFLTLARAGEELTFKTLTNSDAFLFGWRRHAELYDAFRHPGRSYPELVSDIRAFNRKKLKPILEDDLASLLTPLGATDLGADGVETWDPAYALYRRSKEFHARVMKSGVFDYWRKHGFPPQCRAVGADGFACD